MEFYCPQMKTIVPAADFTLDEACSTPLAFNLKYDGGLFFGLYDHSPASRGIKPYPEGTSIMVNSLPGMVIATPLAAFDQGILDSDADQFYTIWLSDDSIMKFLAPEMPFILPADTPNSPPLSLPAWICSNHKVLYLHEGQYHHGFLHCTDTNTWHFKIRSHDGQVKQTIDLPDLA
jgi:hypothetical protein